ncbi:MAG: 6-carboxytetrahydropterin synthase [Methylococcales bacterium]|nr:6-carboxytetrahydropterin synthase [Methylococcales bacterium]
MFSITKEVYFCYGHRLMHHDGKCRHLHGHSVKAAITIEAETLDSQSMVCDFSDIRETASDYIDTYLDHQLLLHQDDPLIPCLQEANQPILILDQHPTAETLARMIYKHVQAAGFPVSQVALWETASSYAIYQEK